MPKLNKILQRVSSGELKELAYRAQEELTRKKERRLYRRGKPIFKLKKFGAIFSASFLKQFSGNSRDVDLVAALRAHVDAEFYPGFACKDKFGDFVKRACPEEHERIVSAADAIVANRFPIFSLGFLSYGDPPQWNYDPILGIRAPEVFYRDIDYLNATIAGDAKVVWELSRLQFVYDLGQAYVLTADEKYPRKFFALLHDWNEQNREYHGINFCSALEFAFRLHSLLWGIYFFKDSPSLDNASAHDIYRLAYVSLTFLNDHLSRYFAPNTHLFGEAYALYIGGMFFPEFRNAHRWESLGYEILTAELDNQITADGMHAELSTAYHAYATEFALSAAILGERRRKPIAAKYRDRLRQMTDVLAAIQRPDGTWPHIGDEDGGRLFFLSRMKASDFRPLLEACRMYLAEGKEVGVTPRNVDSFWLAGSLGGIVPLEKSSSRESIRLLSAGLIASRSECGMYSLLQCGKFGYLESPHSHADMLHVDISVGEDNFLVDPGTNVYAGDLEKRDFYRSERMHNGPAVAGFELFDKRDPFAWRQKPDCTITDHVLGSRSDFYRVSYKIDSGDYAGATFTRTILFLHDQAWVIHDSVASPREGKLCWNFVTPVSVERSKDAVVIRGRAGNLFMLPCHHQSVPVNIEVEECGISDDYLSFRPGTRVRITTPACRRVDVLFLLLPYADEHDLPQRIRVAGEPQRMCLSMTSDDVQDFIFFGDDKEKGVGGVWSDADIAYVRLCNQAIERVVVAGGSSIKFEAAMLFEAKAPIDYADIIADGDDFNAELSEEVEIKVRRRPR